jgi:hypothetical protein
MSVQTIKILIAAVLLLHGLGHVGAIAALAVVARGLPAGPWRPARSWLWPSFPPQAATAVAVVFWLLSAAGFVASAVSFWGVLIPGDLWRQLAVASSIVSIVGIALFFGIWPLFNTLAALAVNIVVLVTQLWAHWPPLSMFGK